MSTESSAAAEADVLLVAFYNKKALGIRYLEAALLRGGYRVRTVYYKDFNSLHPRRTTDRELELLKQEIETCSPSLIGLSVMSSMYLDTINAVISMIQNSFDIPVVCGGAFATMFPEYFLERKVPYVIRSDGEDAMCSLAAAMKGPEESRSENAEKIPGLVFMRGDTVVTNPIGALPNDIDVYGIPVVHSKNACFIDEDRLVQGDPQLDTLSYEVIASRGCPFTCSYCCCENLRRLLPKGVRGVRTRSVKSIIDELKEAKKECRHIAFVHFYDEIFPNLPGWVDEFVVEYKKHINLPFTIWTHPKMVDPEVLKKLVKVGLTEVIMGIQSGSEHIRRDVFHRYESQQDIIDATRIIRESGVFWCSYDFMLQHPFETIEDLKESYWLAKKMVGPYELQLHGLNFLPGTDIVPMAIEAGYYTEEEMNAIMYAPMEEQFGVYWRRETSRESDLWYKMLYCLQFSSIRKKIETFEEDPLPHGEEIDRLYEKAQKMARVRYVGKKGRVVLRRIRLSVMP